MPEVRPDRPDRHRPQRDRDRPVPELPRGLAGPRRAGQDHRALDRAARSRASPSATGATTTIAAAATWTTTTGPRRPSPAPGVLAEQPVRLTRGRRYRPFPDAGVHRAERSAPRLDRLLGLHPGDARAGPRRVPPPQPHASRCARRSAGPPRGRRSRCSSAPACGGWPGRDKARRVLHRLPARAVAERRQRVRHRAALHLLRRARAATSTRCCSGACSARSSCGSP